MGFVNVFSRLNQYKSSKIELYQNPLTFIEKDATTLEEGICYQNKAKEHIYHVYDDIWHKR